MPQPKIHESHAQRQAAYRRRREEATRRQLQEKGLPKLPAISSMPGTARWRQAIAHAMELLCMVSDEMQAYADDRSEAWSESERAEAFQERLDAIDQARQSLEDVIDN